MVGTFGYRKRFMTGFWYVCTLDNDIKGSQDVRFLQLEDSGANPSEIVRSCSKLRNITTVEYYASTRFGLGDQKNDEKLVYFCSFLLLVLSTALCEHIPCHKISWLGIRNIHISSRFRNCLLNTCNQRAMTRPQNVDRQFNAGSFLYC